MGLHICLRTLESALELTLPKFTDDQSVIEYFTEGQCNALAWELHKLTGWTLAIISDYPVGQEDYAGHAFVIDSDAYAIDIRGKQHLDDFWRHWRFLTHIYRFHTSKEYEKEMVLWHNKIHYTKDREAKMWARLIVDMLDS